MLLDVVLKLEKLLFRFSDFQIKLRLIELFLMPLLLHLFLPLLLLLIYSGFRWFHFHRLEITLVLGQTGSLHLLENGVIAGGHALYFFDRRELGLRIDGCRAVSIVGERVWF